MRKNLLLLSIIIFGVAGVWVVNHQPVSPTDEWCTFTALDIGQGDALLIRTSDGQDMLVDGGPGNSVVKRLEEQLPPGDNDIEFVVSTHPDSDHVSGLISVLREMPVRAVLTNGIVVKTKTYQDWITALEAAKPEIYVAQAGQTYNLGKFLHVQVLWPEENLDGQLVTKPGVRGVGGTNDTAAVVRVTCAKSTVLLAADISHELEDTITERYDVSANLLKVNHHGSRYSSSPKFLQEVNPAWAVISVGRANRYGHPHPLALQRLGLTKATILRTDLSGSVTLKTNGQGGWNPIK